MIDNIINGINDILSNKYMYTFFTLFSGIFLGYTLRPIPKWLNKIFDTSRMFKYFVIVIVGLTIMYPIDKTEFSAIIIMAVVILVILELIHIEIEKYLN